MSNFRYERSNYILPHRRYINLFDILSKVNEDSSPITLVRESTNPRFVILFYIIIMLIRDRQDDEIKLIRFNPLIIDTSCNEIRNVVQRRFL